MKLDQWLSSSTAQLEQANVPSARLDALILLEDALEKDRSWLLTHLEESIGPAVQNKLTNQIDRRCQHVPLAYIRERVEFFGRTLFVDESVLVPRPETETMLELLLKLELPDKTAIIDVGTGSGAIAITAKLELPDTEVIGTDIDPVCLRIARKNTETLGADIVLMQGNLLEPILVLSRPTKDLVLLANLPYVPDSHQLNDAAMNEPHDAIFGGSDGLDLYRKLFEQTTGLPSQPKFVLTEALPFQHSKLHKIASASGFKLLRAQDFIQIFVAS